MKLVKYYAWERFFEDKIKTIRKRESKLAITNIIYKTINICFVFSTPPFCAFVIFTCYEFAEARLKSTIAFTTLTLFNILRFPLVVLPKALRAASGARRRAPALPRCCDYPSFARMWLRGVAPLAQTPRHPLQWPQRRSFCLCCTLGTLQSAALISYTRCRGRVVAAPHRALPARGRQAGRGAPRDRHRHARQSVPRHPHPPGVLPHR